MLKNNYPPKIQGVDSVYEINMPYIVGKNGERTVRIVVRTATNQIVSAYPIASTP